MLALKFAALAAGAAMLIATYSPEFGAELILAIASCLA
jgi:hypothetical protein